MKKYSVLIFSFFVCITIYFFIYIKTYPYTCIIESDNFELVVQYADTDTLVIFDIDNTIGRYENGLGNDEWFCYLINQKITQGYDQHAAVLAALPMAYYTHFYLPLILTDNSIPQIIHSLIDKHINVIALTSRGLYLAERTDEQLRALGITFCMHHNSISHNDLLLYLSANPCLYRHDIIFTGSNDKGETLIAFLNALNYDPEKIIFIDDKMYHVRSIETALQNTNIEYIGIRYTGCDHYIHNFDPATAEIQLRSLQQQRNLHPYHPSFNP